MTAFLAFFGLAKLSELRTAQHETLRAMAYAKQVTDLAEADGALVIGADYTAVRNCNFRANQKLLVPPGVRNVCVDACIWMQS